MVSRAMGSSTTVSLEAAAKNERRWFSVLRIFLISLIASCAVFTFSSALQWIVYDDWLHSGGPMRFTGATLAALLTFMIILQRQVARRHKQQELLQRFRTISEMNDRIRNALQVIECTVYVSQPQATAPIRQAVDIIDSALREAYAEVRAFAPPLKQPPAAAVELGKVGKSA
jgi:hypothetical protein